MQRNSYALGTYTLHRMPWGTFVGGAALCTDGRVRKLARISSTADTFFSVPASVRVAGKYVSGFITIQTIQGCSTPTDDDPAIVKFVAYTNRKNASLLPTQETNHA